MIVIFPESRIHVSFARTWIDPCVRRYTPYIHVRILIPPRQLLACLLARSSARSSICLCSSVTLPHSNPHSRAPPRDRAQVTGLGYRCSGVPDTFQCIEFTKETDIAIRTTPKSRDRDLILSTANISSFVFPSPWNIVKFSRNMIFLHIVFQSKGKYFFFHLTNFLQYLRKKLQVKETSSRCRKGKGSTKWNFPKMDIGLNDRNIPRLCSLENNADW